MKIFIFGSVASGKTTLARKLASIYHIPAYEGDCIAWGFSDEQRRKRSDYEQLQIINEINARGEWIIEGTYREAQKTLFDLADIVIFLDTSLWRRRLRIVKRYICQQAGIEKCHYKPSFQMFKHMFRWTNDFERKREEYHELLHSCAAQLINIRTPHELKNLLQLKKNCLSDRAAIRNYK